MSDTAADSPICLPDAVEFQQIGPQGAVADSGDELVENEENLGDLGGNADDGDDSNPCKFIEKSLHYQDMMMTKRHSEERLNFFEEFAKSRPNGKTPTAKLRLYKARVLKVDARIAKFKQTYAEKRVAAKKARAERIAREKEERVEEQSLGKPLKSVIAKEMKKASAVAAKAAADAIKALGDNASNEDHLATGLEAYEGALKKALGNATWKVPPM